jgi:CBS domain-containing protein
MAQRINEIMTSDPVTVAPQTTIAEVAHVMEEEHIGEVLITDEDHLRGVVTDRDLVVRGMAHARDINDTTAQDLASSDLVTCAAQDPVDEAVRLMREHTVRRLPVIQDDVLVGTVSLGDLAVEKDRESVLAAISAAEPNA